MTEQDAPVTWELGEPYERYIGRWSRLLAPVFLEWLGVPAGRRWLDVGCGTGALTTAVLETCAPASVVGVEPSEGFLALARERLGARAELLHGSADAIPLADDSVDVVVSGLVLNFVPDPRAAIAEMVRVTRPTGRIGLYVWDRAGRMELMHIFWDAAGELDPNAPDERARHQISDPGRLEELFAGAGVTSLEARSIDIPTVFTDFDDYWEPFLGGQGPAPAYAMTLSEDERAVLRENLRARLPVRPDGSIHLVARAWAVQGLV